MPEPFLVVSGLATIAGEKHGAGPPLVFLHAGVADRRMWREEMQAFPRFTTIAYDRRGFGETLHADETYSHVDDLRAVLDAVAPGEPAVLVGCSQGGRIALDFALAVPPLARALVLVAPAVSGAPQVDEFAPPIQAWIDKMEAAEEASDVDRINALEAHAWLDGPLQPEGRISGAARELFLAMNELALRAEKRGEEIEPASAYSRLHEVVVPTLVVWGDVDFPHIGARCEHLVRELPNAQALRLPGAAHLPNLEDPARFGRALAAFVNSLPPS